MPYVTQFVFEATKADGKLIGRSTRWAEHETPQPRVSQYALSRESFVEELSDTDINSSFRVVCVNTITFINDTIGE